MPEERVKSSLNLFTEWIALLSSAGFNEECEKSSSYGLMRCNHTRGIKVNAIGSYSLVESDSLVSNNFHVALANEVSQRHIAFTLEANKSSQAKGSVITSGNSGDRVNIGNVDLYSSVILAFDQPVCP